MPDIVADQRPRFHLLALAMAQKLLAEGQHAPTRRVHRKVDRLLEWASRTAPGTSAPAVPPIPEQVIEIDILEEAA